MNRHLPHEPQTRQFHPKCAAYDFYPTPPEATRALLAVQSFDGPVWEPACGTGWISEEFRRTGHTVISTDLVNYGYGQPGRDFLAEQNPLAKHIVTNPPYNRGMADQFIKHALRLTARSGGKVAMLLNTQSLCHPLRHEFYVKRPPAIVYPLDNCVCWPYGDPKRATSPSIGKQRYCWMVWYPRHTGPTWMQWLSTGQYR